VIARERPVEAFCKDKINKNTRSRREVRTHVGEGAGSVCKVGPVRRKAAGGYSMLEEASYN